MVNAAPVACPRCRKPLRRNAMGERICYTHGTVFSPRLAGDAVEEGAPIRQRARAPRSGYPWSPREVEYLMRNKDRLPAREIARRLGRTERGVHTFLSKLAIRKQRRSSQVQQAMGVSRVWPQRQRDALEDFAKPGSLRQLASRMGRSHGAVRAQLYRSGLRASDADGMLSARQVAGLYGCSDVHVARCIARGVLTASKSGRWWRIAPEDAEAARVALSRGRGSRSSERRGPGDTFAPPKIPAQNRDRFFRQ